MVFGLEHLFLETWQEGNWQKIEGTEKFLTSKTNETKTELKFKSLKTAKLRLSVVSQTGWFME